MPATSAVLFDYGRTLVTFEYPSTELEAVVEHFRPRIAEATGLAAPRADEIMTSVLLPLEQVIDNPSEDETPYLDVFAAAWRNAGMALPDELLYEILDAEQRVWDRAACVDCDAFWALEWLAGRGVRRGICSNAPFPATMMRRQVDANGLARRVDAVVFSSEVGRRKPAREIYAAALEAVGARAEDALFIGDRVREDYAGPRAVGMRAAIVTRHATERPDAEIPTIESLRELPRIL
jgi:FMN phosphatase YigB (HAD superfamily)